MQPDELKAIRKQLELSQSDLGAAIGLSRVMVSQMESGHAVIAPRTQLAVRALLADRHPNNANLSRAIVAAMAQRFREALDANDTAVTLTRDEAAMTLGILDAVAETMA